MSNDSVFHAEFFNRLGQVKYNPPSVQFVVEKVNDNNRGGPRAAEISAYGDETSLAQLLNMLGYRVKIYNQRGDLVWWGQVVDAKLDVNGVTIGSSLDSVANYISVAYTTATATGGSQRATTAWKSDNESITEYKRKAKLLSSTNATSATADAQATSELTKYAWPVPSVGLSYSNTNKGTLTCEGHWGTLAWDYYNDATGIASFTADPSGYIQPTNPRYYSYYGPVVNGSTEVSEDITIEVGYNAGKQGMYQSFTYSGTVPGTISSLQLKGNRQGSPADNHTVTIHADSSGTPGSLLMTATLDPMIVSNTSNAYFDVSGWDKQPIFLPGQVYGIKVVRTGALSTSNYIRMCASTTLGYASGVGKVYNGTTWVAPSPNADYLFKVEFDGRSNIFPIGALSASSALAESINSICSSSYAVGSVDVKVGKVGNPVDNIRMTIRPDSAGSPGSPVVTATIAGSTITKEDYLSFQMTSYPLHTSVAQIWFCVDRDGSLDPANFYYLVGGTSSGYTSGTPKFYNGGGWSAYSTMEPFFTLRAVRETTQQIVDIITAKGQFFTGIIVENTSGVFAPVNRTSDQTALAVIESLLNMGTSTGTGLTARVLADYRIAISAEPVSSVQDYLLNKDFNLSNKFNVPLPNNLPVSGIWARLVDLPVIGATGYALGPLAIYVDECEIDRAGKVKLKPRNGDQQFNRLNLKRG